MIRQDPAHEQIAYNNTQNASTGHTAFKLNYRYHSCISFKNDSNFRFKSRSDKELAKELKDLIFIC